MTYKIGICDDSAADREYIASLTRGWAEKADIVVQLFEFTSAENFLFCAQDRCLFDILLLDIEMGAMDGVSLARKIRQSNETIQIVFITGYSDYIAEGYDVSALHYLMKPVKPEKIYSVLNRAVEKLKKDEKTLTLDAGGQIIRVPVGTIRFAEVQGNYVTIHANLDHTVKMTLSELEKGLDDRFYRVGRSGLLSRRRISQDRRKGVG